ncbi:hypothetical protein MP638_005167 [Amoeboaphelidium occidentale]|nr:hypothetical protein MP638_005167 [Amoeboaphelidium occidentale]
MSALFPQNHWNQPKYHDPWAKAHEWRYEHPVVAQKYIWRKAFPGLGVGIAAFVVYCVAEGVYNSAAGGSNGHGHGHSEGHGHGHK